MRRLQTTDAQGNNVALSYWPDGQLAGEDPANAAAPASISKAAYAPGQTPDGEHFLWDGLALLRRDNTLYIAEPHPSGGAIVASRLIGNPAEDTYYLNDLLGTTLAVVHGDQITFNHLTSFGQMRAPAQAAPQPGLKPAGLQTPTPVAPSLPLPASAPIIH